MIKTADVAIVGSGIVGLAHAYMALRKGLRVVLFERDEFPVGASVRNFGLVWPIGQEPGKGLERALRSRAHWQEISERAGIWCNPNGSLHLAYKEDELAVLEEFVNRNRNSGYLCGLISASEVVRKSPAVRQEGLLGALWSSTEMTVYSREAIRKLPMWLEEKMGLVRRFNQLITEIHLPEIHAGREIWEVERVVICSGPEFQTLYPQVYAQAKLTKCKLQMMKLVPRDPVPWGPSLCAGLTLGHYSAFSSCTTLPALLARFDRENPQLRENGIHILVSQTPGGELIVGDSHHYGITHEPFDSEMINQLILEYLDRFLPLSDYQISERWHGIYPKSEDQLHVVMEPVPGVQLVNGLGGAGMTLSFGLAEEVVGKW
jgi:FAD dependent oxidoreductase TIGR03364